MFHPTFLPGSLIPQHREPLVLFLSFINKAFSFDLVSIMIGSSDADVEFNPNPFVVLKLAKPVPQSAIGESR